MFVLMRDISQIVALKKNPNSLNYVQHYDEVLVSRINEEVIENMYIFKPEITFSPLNNDHLTTITRNSFWISTESEP